MRSVTLISREYSRLLRLWVAFGAVALVVVGCRNDMHDSARVKPLEMSTFFADSQSSRPMIEGTVARDGLREDALLYTGKLPAGSRGADTGSTGGTSFATVLPMKVTKEILLRGEERYNVFCSPCHARTGNGNGMIVQRGLSAPAPPSLHIDRLVNAPAGHFYDVITNGFGAMYSYASRIRVQDRWAIVAYIRALQLSQAASVNELPAEDRTKVEALPK